MTYEENGKWYRLVVEKYHDGKWEFYGAATEEHMISALLAAGKALRNIILRRVWWKR